MYKSWPKYATFDEDELLGKEKLNRKYEWLQPVTWAMTNTSEYELQMQICNVVLATNTMWRIVLNMESTCNYVVRMARDICGS